MYCVTLGCACFSNLGIFQPPDGLLGDLGEPVSLLTLAIVRMAPTW